MKAESPGWLRVTAPYWLIPLVGAILFPLSLNGYFHYDDHNFLDGALRVLHNISNGSGTIWGALQADFVQFEDVPYMHYRPGAYALITEHV